MNACAVCGLPVPLRAKYCSDFCRKAKECRLCGNLKVGQSPFCHFCRMDRMKGAQLIHDPDWISRQAEKTKKTIRTRRPKLGPAGLDWCSGCQTWLDPRWFLKLKEIQAGKTIPALCRPCRSSRQHASRLKSEFGMSVDRYQELLDLQGGGCAICGGNPKTARLAVDHDHTAEDGRVRGLLCSKCNTELLNGVRHSPRLAMRAALYLINPPAVAGIPVPEPDLGVLVESGQQ